MRDGKLLTAISHMRISPAGDIMPVLELTVYVTQQVGISIETNYLMGDSKFPLREVKRGK